jgi:hypothetical protein
LDGVCVCVRVFDGLFEGVGDTEHDGAAASCVTGHAAGHGHGGGAPAAAGQ